MQIIHINSEYITLGQFFKISGIAPTGGAVKHILAEEVVLVNGEPEQRRGRKLYPGDEVVYENEQFVVAASNVAKGID
jgi:ribosome-associated protein